VVYPDGNADAAGIARLPNDGTYRAVGGSAQCADLDHDGFYGVVGLSIAFESVGDGDRAGSAQAEIVPDDEIDEPGVYPVRVRWNEGPAGDGVLRVRFLPAAGP